MFSSRVFVSRARLCEYINSFLFDVPNGIKFKKIHSVFDESMPFNFQLIFIFKFMPMYEMRSNILSYYYFFGGFFFREKQNILTLIFQVYKRHINVDVCPCACVHIYLLFYKCMPVLSAH